MKNKPSIDFFEKKARELRATCVQLAHDGREGHLNGALSSVDLLIALYYSWMNIDCVDVKNDKRDRFIFSKGHACTSLYAALADRNFFPKKLLLEYAKNNSPLPSHPCIHALPALEASSGSLGHGLGMAAGMAYGLKLDGKAARVVALLSDGACNEGSIWEAAMFGAAKKLDNVLAIVDYNGVQSVGYTDELTGGASFEEKFRAFGWSAVTINGHNIPEIIDTLEKFPFELGKPSAIIAKTRAGAGISFMENQVLWHYRVPSKEDVDSALKELEAKPIY